MSRRRAVVLINSSRIEAVSAARDLASILIQHDFELVTPTEISVDNIAPVSVDNIGEVEVAIVLGGDGTILRGAEVTLLRGIPLLGINLGHVGFLAEVSKPSLADIAKSIVDKSYVYENRMVLGYSVMRDGNEISQGWALNEITVERERTTMVELFVEIDRRPLSHWGCDGLICSTPTGSTAYAFSAGGPVLWPEIDALVLLPISAHALFSRPMVVSTQSEIVVTVESQVALLSADALRKLPLVAGDRVVITRNPHTIKLAHVNPTLFTDRLVAKFKLPIEGWRGE
ncbi:MAG: NAD kinase [Candidatus Planktophila sp.]